MSGQPAVQQVVLDISGMTCATCAARIEKVVGRMDGVEQINVNLALHRASVAIVPAKTSMEQIESKIEQLGYKVRKRISSVAGIADREGEDPFDIRYTGLRFVVSFVLMLPFVWAMAKHHDFAASLPVPELLLNPWFQLALATPVQFVIGLPFYVRAFYALKSGSANMDVLVVIGTLAAYMYSHYLMFHPGHAAVGHAAHGAATGAYTPLYFDAAVMIMTIVWLGKWLEAIARKRTLGSLHQLHALRPEAAHVVKGGKELRVSVADIAVGDIIVVRPGESIPVDGFVTDGHAAVNEAMISGESLPVDKQPGDRVISGTLNTNGVLSIQASGVGGSTTLSRMIDLMEEAQSSKAPIQRMADTISAVFVPVIIGLATITYAVWYLVLEPGAAGVALEKAISVLLIACPCALGLATPTSILVGSGRAAQLGILFKEGKYLELVPRADVMLLDKTGTLTAGAPRLIGVMSARGPEASLLRLLAAAEQPSEHPLAHSIVGAAQREGLVLPECSGFAAVPGRGIRAIVDGRTVLAGTRKWLQEQGVPPVPAFNRIERWERQGSNVVFAAVDGAWAGAVALSDTLKPASRQAVQQLTAMGVTVMMVTGDHRSTAEAIARQVGIRHVHAERLPEAKAALIKELQERGCKVAMVGDGINDAPALSAADIGIAVARGTDIAKAAADVVLIKNDLHGLLHMIRISRRTMRIIRQNLGFSLLYNVLAIPFAVCGYLAPWMACTAMAFSSVTVLCNALRLRKA
ncbi:heavy metal translocating P-type ATPase [Paenibacillus piri]|uniref:Copper-exporting P-type ATPase n=1 Tax=Paenibacillus piri TaxID=2547395 RepID=A0A4R5KRR5_9BACL|nr:heavy metal translocating P-type ATPase [Paenibacillus piri]TDF97500.1 copper-translocating P-type ATPase [Paenibacillus piri]